MDGCPGACCCADCVRSRRFLGADRVKCLEAPEEPAMGTDSASDPVFAEVVRVRVLVHLNRAKDQPVRLDLALLSENVQARHARRTGIVQAHFDGIFPWR